MDRPDLTPVPIDYPTGTNPPPHTETSPVILGDRCFVTTQYSYAGTWNGRTITIAGEPTTRPDPSNPWRHSYAGVFGAATVDGHLVTVIHGENKNEIIDGKQTVNTITGDRTCFSQYTHAGYSECWSCYFGVVSVAIDGVDRGPVVWPAAGYVKADDRQASCGVRHPSLFRYGGFLWLHYIDCTTNAIVVARSPLASRGSPQSWTTLTADGWKPSLPAGPFRHRLPLHGPAGKSVLGNGRASYYFAVERDPKGSGLIGLEWGQPDASKPEVCTTIWRSDDMTRWTRHREIWSFPAYRDCAICWPRPLPNGSVIAVDLAGHVSLLELP